MNNIYDNEKTPTLYCIGEALIDFIPGGAMNDGTPLLAPMPGGATANTAVAAAKLGARSSFIGTVGDDGYGRMLADVLSGYGVLTDHLHMTQSACTTLAFVTLSPDGDREFTFARKPGADMMLSEDDIPDGLFGKDDILHFGSLGLVPGSPSAKAHMKAIKMAKAAGSLVSFDPNVRLPLWDDHEELKYIILGYLSFADIVKVSSDEMPFIFGTDEEVAVAMHCFAKGASVLFVTRGKDGAAVYTQSFSSGVPGRPDKAVDTTGAGDAFNGAMLSRFLGKSFEDCLKPDNLSETLKFANAAGSFSVTRKGAMAGSPTAEEMSLIEID
jgi:fructokinase